MPLLKPNDFFVIFASFLHAHGPLLDLTSTFAGKNVVEKDSVMTFMRKLIVATKAWHFQPKISSFLPNAFLVTFASFLCAQGPLLDPTLTFAGKNIVNIH